jgi:hypothetical protein
MKTIISQANQTVWDIAIQEMGSPEGVFPIMAANAFLRLDVTIPAGTAIQVPDTVIDADVVDYLSRNGIKPATGTGDELNLTDDNMIKTEQKLAYDLAGGAKSFDGERLYNLREMLSVQVNYTDVSLAGTAYVEQSLDGINYDPIADASQALPTGTGSITFNLDGLVTDYCRVRIALAGATTGTIDEVIWRV